MNEVAASPAPEVPAETADSLPIDIATIEVTCARAFGLHRATAPGLLELTRTLRGHLGLLIPPGLAEQTPLIQGAARDATRLPKLPDNPATARTRARTLAQVCLILLEPHRPPGAPTDKEAHG
ncbi:hypothetical protein ACH4FX_38185 [Streptomyces sp. NPDC018019]|uniref:hypothetical protein n=1 Tax=Streptomyces sp. NPDC018019 TaxID=3365030 RepID=UPI00378B38F6